MKRAQTWLFTGAATLLAAALLTPLSPRIADAAPEVTSLNQTLGTIVSVTGTGSVDRKPDRASVSLGVTMQRDTAGQAQNAVNKVMTKIIENVKDLKLPGVVIQTAGMNIHPLYDHGEARRGRRPEPRIVGFQAQNTITVRTDNVDRAGEIADAGVKAGANQIHGISFELKDPHDAQLEAIQVATQRARSKADAMARAMDMRVIRVLDVTEAGASRPQPRYNKMSRGMEMAMSADAVAAPVEPGQVGTSVRVTMTCELSK